MTRLSLAPLCALPLLLLAAACGDPYGTCREGNYRDPGPGCTAPTLGVVVDGDGADWARPELDVIPMCSTGESPDLPPCQPGFVRSMQFAIDGDTLVFHLTTVGPPVPAGVGYYNLLVYDYYDHERGDSVGFFWDPATISLNDHTLYGFAIEAVTGADGLELRVPLDALPFVGGALTTASVYTFAGGWQPARGWPVYVCWDPTVPEGCAFL